jgi:glycerol-3-phosphate acyltransferase PlsY
VSWAWFAAAAAVGYLVGSISFTRLVGSRVAPGVDLLETTLTYADDGEPVPVQGVSASSLRAHAGGRWALLVVVLDIAKATIPALAFRLAAPDTDATLVAAAAAVIGHVWPVWHGFIGGFGVSPMIGGLLVIDPLALVVTIAIGGAIGVVLADRLVAFDGWTVLLIPWFAWRGEAAELGYAAVVVAVYWFAMRAEVLDHVRRVRRGGRPWRERLRDLRSYTGDPGRPG